MRYDDVVTEIVRLLGDYFTDQVGRRNWQRHLTMASDYLVTVISSIVELIHSRLLPHNTTVTKLASRQLNDDSFRRQPFMLFTPYCLTLHYTVNEAMSTSLRHVWRTYSYLVTFNSHIHIIFAYLDM